MTDAPGNCEDLNICHVNCQSLYAHIDEFRFYFGKKQFDIICMSETWLRPGVTDEMVKLPGYNLFRCDRANRMGGGVAFFIASYLTASILRCSEAAVNAKPEYIIAEIIVNNRSKLL